jgi:hypothetical protein
MQLRVTLLAAMAALSAGTAQAATLEIDDALVRVTVIPEDRGDIRVEVTRPHAGLPLQVSTAGDRTVIDGGLERRLRDCDRGRDASFRVRGVGRVKWDEVPQVVVRTPRAVSVRSSGAVFGTVGRSASLDLRSSGCSGWTIADVAGPAAIHESGASTIRMGQSGRLDVRISGAAQFHATRVRGMDVHLSGAGQVKVDELQGPMAAQVSGVGQVRVAQGRASNVRAGVSGIGQVAFDGEADALEASVSGMGTVRVRQVNGPVSRSVSGGGSVSVGGRRS